jgi:hypothetical protein
MNLFENMNQAAQHGSREEFVQANRAWFEAAVRTEVCTDCGTSARPLHPWLGRRELVCEPCDEDRRSSYESWLDEMDHQRAHAAGRL